MFVHLHNKIVICLGLLMLSFNGVIAGQLDDFSSDGCSQFPDGTIAQQDLWCDCCITHDIAYWQGGNRQQKKQADLTLRKCVLQKTGNSILANSMYYGVTLGGSPVFFTWYGWRYGRGYQSLNQYEKQMVIEKLQLYRLSMPQSFCNFEHPLKRKVTTEWQNLFN